MDRARTLLLALGLMSPAAAVAGSEPAPTAPREHRLTQAEIDRVLEDAARKREAGAVDPSGALEAPKPGLAVQGEVGVSVGSGGYRSTHGSVVVPLSDDLGIFTFEADRLNARAGRWRNR